AGRRPRSDRPLATTAIGRAEPPASAKGQPAMKNKLLELVEAGTLKADNPKFAVGDTVDIHQRILEGQKERVQVFSGTLIASKGPKGREMITIRRIVQGEGVERVFPVNSPKIAKIEVKRSGQTRRAKLDRKSVV